MLKRFLFAIPYVVLGLFATTGNAFAAFDPTSDELSLLTLAVSGVLLAFLSIVYAIATYLGINKPEEVEIPDHAHDHRYAGHH
jgi:hypothetical protein